jgi:hypothetical protein
MTEDLKGSAADLEAQYCGLIAYSAIKEWQQQYDPLWLFPWMHRTGLWFWRSDF